MNLTNFVQLSSPYLVNRVVSQRHRSVRYFRYNASVEIVSTISFLYYNQRLESSFSLIRG